jgi:hypothetical protein
MDGRVTVPRNRPTVFPFGFGVRELAVGNLVRVKAWRPNGPAPAALPATPQSAAPTVEPSDHICWWIGHRRSTHMPAASAATASELLGSPSTSNT